VGGHAERHLFCAYHQKSGNGTIDCGSGAFAASQSRGSIDGDGGGKQTGRFWRWTGNFRYISGLQLDCGKTVGGANASVDRGKVTVLYDVTGHVDRHLFCAYHQKSGNGTVESGSGALAAFQSSCPFDGGGGDRHTGRLGRWTGNFGYVQTARDLLHTLGLQLGGGTTVVGAVAAVDRGEVTVL
jgi:hypothetical protein